MSYDLKTGIDDRYPELRVEHGLGYINCWGCRTLMTDVLRYDGHHHWCALCSAGIFDHDPKNCVSVVSARQLYRDLFG